MPRSRFDGLHVPCSPQVHGIGSRDTGADPSGTNQPEIYAPTLRELRAMFVERALENLACARRCLHRARAARSAGDQDALRKWMWHTRVLRAAAPQWRDRAKCIVPCLVAMLLLVVGCHRGAQGTHADVHANLRLTGDATTGQVQWTLVLPLTDYHELLETAPNGQERARVRELIRAGLDTNGLRQCAAVESVVTRDGPNGIAFSGLCRSPAVPVSDHGI